MKIDTRVFGEVEVDQDKIICFENGIIGFPDLKKFVLLHDEEKGSGSVIRWMQSVEEPAFAMPVLDPLSVVPDYNPEVEDELLKPLGSLEEESLLVFVTMTVPADLKKMSLNLCAPVIVHTETRKACQVILDDSKYAVKYEIYDILKNAKKAGE